MKSIELLEQYGSMRRSLGRAITPFLQEMGIGPKQLMVLRAVGKRGECSMSDIAEATASDMASVTRMVTSLITTGWVDKQRAEGDRRQWRVKLAPKGEKQWQKIDSLFQEIASAFVSELTEAEQEQLSRLLAKVQKGLEASLASHSSDIDDSSVNQTQE
jgi:DNA-binding MarR family transcriptional regulator